MLASGSVVEFDKLADTIKICGVTYAMELFRTMAMAQPGQWLRVGERTNGWLDVTQVDEVTERAFDYITKNGIYKKP